MPVTGLNHYLIVAKNLERTKDFYCEVLGMELAERPDFGFPGYWLKLGDEICVHLASQDPNRIRDMFLLKKHPKGTTGSGSVDHIAFLAQNPGGYATRLRGIVDLLYPVIEKCPRKRVNSTQPRKT